MRLDDKKTGSWRTNSEESNAIDTQECHSVDELPTDAFPVRCNVTHTEQQADTALRRRIDNPNDLTLQPFVAVSKYHLNVVVDERERREGGSERERKIPCNPLLRVACLIE